MDEEPLQNAILAAVNSVMSQKESLMADINSALDEMISPAPSGISLSDIKSRLEEIDRETKEIVVAATHQKGKPDFTTRLKALMDEVATLKEQRSAIEEQRRQDAQRDYRVKAAAAVMENAPDGLAEWDEQLIRQLVETVKVVSADEITVYLRNGMEVRQELQK